MSTVRRSLGFAFLERYLLIALQLLSFTLLARLLTPQQIGLYSVSMALVSMAQVVRDFGLANYLIQRKELSPEDVGSALGLSLLLGGGLFVGINAAAPWIAGFYSDASLARIVGIISINFLILPFNSISIALLRRDMRFDALMRINVSAATVGCFTTLGLAWAGVGSASLAWGEIASSLTMAAGVSLAGAWGRLVRPQLSRWRDILGFGGPVTAANVVTSVSMDINDLAVGKMLNFGQVAIASRAQGLMNLFARDIMGTVRSVAYPAFSRVHREGGALEQRHVQSLAAVSAVAWPFYGFVGLFALEVLRLMFGPQWDASAPLVPIYCAAGAVSVLNSLVPTVMLAAGHSKLVALADLIIQPVKALLLVGVLWWWRALEPLALGFLAMAIVAVPYFYAFKQRCLPSDFRAIARELSRNALLALICLLPSALAAAWLRPAGEALALPTWLGCAALTSLLWLAGLKLLGHPLYGELLALLRRKVAS
ncbi:O-antigen/teichoic acid export membrane protein [Pelomonas saccharophila]|uniref:O-antigen/teichoic acid export membrane protein n=1 Tax=Roseateles saccharophilus TaxID=304 RepID=A0ABU1YU66_ROSSA|nr:oligosaccharide flippase family protein [Roseateles saccharophilus]MDR7272414.1 O-antigen/teichoic acid export membrane protein [Roseateles saccharophilus]